MDFISSIINFFNDMPRFYRQVIFTISVALSVYLTLELLGEILFAQIVSWQVNIRLKINQKNKKKKTLESVLYPPIIFSPKIKPEDIYGVNIFPWNTFFILGGIFGGILGLFGNSSSSIDKVTNVLTFAIGGFVIVFFAQWFFTYIRKIKTEKDALETMDLIQNELVSQITLVGALNSIKNAYQSHVKFYGQKSWYYNNYVLARLVYLISTEPEFIAVNILKKLGEELGDIVVIKKIMQNSLMRIGQFGDAGTVLKEQIEAYNQIYISSKKEEIPQFGDKLFFPIMATHFIPFLIIVMWPIIKVINEMMSGGLNTPINPIFK